LHLFVYFFVKIKPQLLQRIVLEEKNMDEYEHYEAECGKRREENNTFLIGFSRFLQNKKLSKKSSTGM